MSERSYSYLDIVVMEPVRARFAAGDCLAILSRSLDEVLWANGTGARLLGADDVFALVGADPRLPLAARRQIEATSGYPEIGQDRRLVVRLGTGLAAPTVTFSASDVEMPDGERAILLAAPASGATRDPLLGLDGEGRHLALLDAEGMVRSASPDFERAGIARSVLAGLAMAVRTGPDRLVKRMIPARTGPQPAGLARLSENPVVSLLMVLEPADEEAELPAGHGSVAYAETVVPSRELDAPATPAAAPAAPAAAQPSAVPTPSAATPAAPETEHAERAPSHEPELSTLEFQTPASATTAQRSAGDGHDNDWYFNGADDVEAGRTRPVDLDAAPVRFVWRIDAEGRFSHLSPEFAAAFGPEAADVIGRRFGDVSQVFDLDPSGEIAALLQRRDTWSGRSVLWPVAGTDLKVPVDLAALPAYGRDRGFEGYRGFGVARMGDAVIDPEAIGLALRPAGAPARDPQAQPPAPAADNFAGEPPAIATTQTPGRRESDKIIRLAERRLQPRDLSNADRQTFREIGEKLKEAGVEPAENAGTRQEAISADVPVEANLPASEQQHSDATAPTATVATLAPIAAGIADITAAIAGEADRADTHDAAEQADADAISVAATVVPEDGIADVSAGLLPLNEHAASDAAAMTDEDRPALDDATAIAAEPIPALAAASAGTADTAMPVADDVTERSAIEPAPVAVPLYEAMESAQAGDAWPEPSVTSDDFAQGVIVQPVQASAVDPMSLAVDPDLAAFGTHSSEEDVAAFFGGEPYLDATADEAGPHATVDDALASGIATLASMPVDDAGADVSAAKPDKTTHGDDLRADAQAGDVLTALEATNTAQDENAPAIELGAQAEAEAAIVSDSASDLTASGFGVEAESAEPISAGEPAAADIPTDTVEASEQDATAVAATGPDLETAPFGQTTADNISDISTTDAAADESGDAVGKNVTTDGVPATELASADATEAGSAVAESAAVAVDEESAPSIELGAQDEAEASAEAPAEPAYELTGEDADGAGQPAPSAAATAFDLPAEIFPTIEAIEDDASPVAADEFSESERQAPADDMEEQAGGEGVSAIELASADDDARVLGYAAAGMAGASLIAAGKQAAAAATDAVSTEIADLSADISDTVAPVSDLVASPTGIDALDEVAAEAREAIAAQASSLVDAGEHMVASVSDDVSAGLDAIGGTVPSVEPDAGVDEAVSETLDEFAGGMAIAHATNAAADDVVAATAADGIGAADVLDELAGAVADHVTPAEAVPLMLESVPETVREEVVEAFAAPESPVSEAISAASFADLRPVAESEQAVAVEPEAPSLIAQDAVIADEIRLPAQAEQSDSTPEAIAAADVDEFVALPETTGRTSPVFLPSAFAGALEERAPGVDTGMLSRLPLPILIHAGDVLHYANREFLQLTGHASLRDVEAAGGLGSLFGEPTGNGGDERKLTLRSSDGTERPVDAFLQSVAWEGGKALLLSLRPLAAAAPGPVMPAPAEPVSVANVPASEAELARHVEELRAIIDTATDGVVLIDNDGLIRSISHAAEALFGTDSGEIAGRHFTSLFAIESQKPARDYLEGLSGNGVASVLNDGREVIGREAKGRFIPLFMTIGRLPAQGGYCAVVRDITQWKRAEEELTQARMQAERASSQKTDFLARVSHEIRTPLNAIIGFSELMLDEKFGPITNDRYRDYLRDINKSGNHVLDLVNDLLDISKIEAGQLDMSYEAVALNESLAEAVAMMQPQANRERVIIRSSLASSLPDVVADLRSVKQIALNLLSNAIRYTPAGGQVIISTSYESSGDVVLRVRDTGIGMAPAEIEQALKPFKQVNALKRARGDGTGLGLPLTKALVEANRARFAIHSTPGEGTLVEIQFPSTRVLAH